MSATVVYAGGWAGHRHVGDDAILRAHLDELARLAPGAVPLVLGPEPERLAARFGAQAAPGLNPLLWRGLDPGAPDVGRALARRTTRLVATVRAGRTPRDRDLGALVERLATARAVVVAGAGALTSAYRAVGLWPAIATVLLARALGVPVAVSGVTLGPVDDALDRAALLAALRAAERVTVRDEHARVPLLRRAGIAAEGTWDDAAWLAPGTPSAALAGGAPYALLTVADGTPTASLAAVARALQARGIAVLGVPMDFVRQGDEARLLAVASAAPGAVEVLRPLPDDADLRALAAGATLVAGGRYHGAVFAAVGGAPALLVHEGAYQRRKAEALARLAGPLVRALPAATPAEDAAVAAVVQAGHPRGGPHVPGGPLPAAAWAAAHALR
jgi:polysaccharide pyruvyl transferase WcaK-like protein